MFSSYKSVQSKILYGVISAYILSTAYLQFFSMENEKTYTKQTTIGLHLVSIGVPDYHCITTATWWSREGICILLWCRIRRRHRKCGLSGNVPLRVPCGALYEIILSRLALPLRKPRTRRRFQYNPKADIDSQKESFTGRQGILNGMTTDQPSGKDGGLVVGPSWFVGVGGRVIAILEKGRT